MGTGLVRAGIDVLLEGEIPWERELPVGLLCNQASVDRELVPTGRRLQQHPAIRLSCLLSPQHGFHAEKQDNMIESGHGRDPSTGLPVFSLYGETRKPTPEMLEHFEVLVIDLVDVGTRVYTFLYTLAYCLEAAAASGKQVVVLDRPNPIGGIAVEGNLLQPECRSFVGLYSLPMRHGLTFGELALLVNREAAIGAALTVVPLKGWRRRHHFRDTGLPWVYPSPNMPTPETAMVYPGQVLWEGTNVSEGRGTALPFELVGAPYWEPERLAARLTAEDLPGCRLRPVVFEPTSGKWAGEGCRGFQLHVIDPERFRPYRTSLALLQAVMHEFPAEFAYKQPPYEYEYERLPLDLILGDRRIREELERGVAAADLERSWQPELAEFERLRRDYLIYQD